VGSQMRSLALVSLLLVVSLAAFGFGSPYISAYLKADLIGDGGQAFYTPTIALTPSPSVLASSTPVYCWSAPDGSLVTCEDGLLTRGVCPSDGPGAAYCAALLAVTGTPGAGAGPTAAVGAEGTPEPTSAIFPGTPNAPATVVLP